MMKNNRLKGPFILLVFSFIGILFAVFIVGGLWLISHQKKVPLVEILSPSSSQYIESGTEISVLVQAESDSGVSRVEFYVDGVLKGRKFMDNSNEVKTLVMFHWLDTSIGRHQLNTIAYNQFERASEADEIFIEVRARTFLQPQPDFIWIPPGSDNSQGQIIQGDDASETISGETNGAQDSISMEEDGEEHTVVDEVGTEQPEAELQVEGAVEDDDLPTGDGAEDMVFGEDLIASPDDDPPTVLLFDVTPQRDGGEVIARISAEVADDLGISRILLTGQLDGADPVLVNFLDCLGEFQCSLQRNLSVGPGTWLFTLSAFDTSGQSTNPQLAFLDVVPNEEGLPVAIADIDFGALELVEDPIGDQLGELVNQDLINFRDIIGGDNLDLPVAPNLGELFSGEEQEVFHDVEDCIAVIVEPMAIGNLITVRFVCEEVAPEGTHLYWDIQRQLTHIGGWGAGFEIVHEEYFSDISIIRPGIEISFLDENVFCGANNFYRFRFSWKSSINAERSHYLEVVDLRDVESPDCPPGSYDHLNLQAEVRFQGVFLTWQILPSDEWPSWGNVHYQLWKHQPDTFDKEEIATGELSPEILMQEGAEFSLMDSFVSCGYTEYYYTLAVFQFDTILATDTVLMPRIPCPQGSIGNLEIRLIPGYDLDPFAPVVPSPRHYEAIYPHVNIPPGFEWPEGQNLSLRIVTTGEARHQPSDHVNEIQINSGVRTNGYEFFTVFIVQCGNDEYPFHLELWDSGRLIEHGPEFAIDSPPCLPNYDMVPNFIRATGTDNSAICGNAPYCVMLEWENTPPYPNNQSRDVLLPVARITLVRDLASLGLLAEDHIWEFSSEMTSFVDVDIPCGEYLGQALLRYKIVGIADPGIYSAWSFTTAFMETPDCTEPYVEDGTIR